MQQANENTYPYSMEGFINAFILEKQQSQDREIKKITDEVYNINLKLNDLIPDGYNYIENEKRETVSGNIMNQRDNHISMIDGIIIEVEKLEGLEDIRDQVEFCASICEKTLTFLKQYNVSNHNNYCKKVMHLFLQSVKRNYGKHLFTAGQVKLLTDMLYESKKLFIDEKKYWDFDEQLYDAGLSVFPEED